MPIPFIIGALAATAGLTGVTGVAATAAGAAIAYNKAKKEKEDSTKPLETNPSIPTKTIYTTDEAMRVLGMSKPTILKKLKDGSIPFEGSGGRGGFRIRAEALEAYAIKNNIVPNWGVDNTQVINAPDSEELEAIIKYREIEKEQLELDLEELELEEDDSKDHKRNIIQIKKKIKSIDKDIQEYKMFLIGMNAMENMKEE